MTYEASNPVKSFLTTNDVVTALDELGAAGVTEVAGHIDRPQSIVHNHLDTLRELDYAVKEDGQYRLSLQFFRLGERVRRRTPLYGTARPQVRKLAEETGELVTLLIEEQARGIYLEVERGDREVRYPAVPGTAIHLHCSAAGKVILAHLPRERVERILDWRGLPAQTENTITDRKELFAELASVREEGFAYDRQEFRKGLTSVSVPIRTDEGSVLGGLSIAGPNRRMTDRRLDEEIHDLLLRARNVVELNLNEPNIRRPDVE